MYAFISGASRGIGKETALIFAKNDYNLILTCKNNYDMLEELAQKIKNDYNVKVICKKCDIGNYKDVSSLFAELKSNNLMPDIVINNAAYSYVGLIQDMNIDDWNNTINTNLNSLFYVAKEVIPSMINRKSGKIINISSVWGMHGASTEVAYSASKGGVISFTKALAKELAPSNIQVNSISFGAIDTDMNSFLNDDDRHCLMEEIPTGRFGSALEAAQMIYSVASSPDYLTGANICMDGAWT